VIRVVAVVLLLAAAVCADTVVTRSGTIKGVVTMPDSSTVSVVLPLGGIRTLLAASVQAISFSDSTRYRVFEIPLRKLGICVDQGGSAKTSSAPVQDAPRTPVPVSEEHKVPGAEPQYQSFLLASYQSMKRDPAMAGLLSAFVPTLGHVYAGEAGTGAAFAVGEVALVVGAALTGNAAAGTDSSESVTILTVVSTVCWVAAVVTKICECGDAVNAANRYNEKLRERLGLQIGLRPSGHRAALGLACRF
jgi:hypothetical protein